MKAAFHMTLSVAAGLVVFLVGFVVFSHFHEDTMALLDVIPFVGPYLSEALAVIMSIAMGLLTGTTVWQKIAKST